MILCARSGNVQMMTKQRPHLRSTTLQLKVIAHTRTHLDTDWSSVVYVRSAQNLLPRQPRASWIREEKRSPALDRRKMGEGRVGQCQNGVCVDRYPCLRIVKTQIYTPYWFALLCRLRSEMRCGCGPRQAVCVVCVPLLVGLVMGWHSTSEREGQRRGKEQERPYVLVMPARGDRERTKQEERLFLRAAMSRRGGTGKRPHLVVVKI